MNKLLLCLGMVFCTHQLMSQNVGISADGAAPDPSAMIDVSATNKGALIPRLTTAQRDAVASPATGLFIFNTDCGYFNYYDGSVWRNIKDADVSLSTPGSVSGSTSVFCGVATVYSISAVSGATSYTWTVPGGWTINSGQGTTSLNTTTGSTSGNVCVTASNGCETTSSSCTAVTITSLSPPGSITGSTSLCSAVTTTYSISAVSGATSYTWTVPGDWTINSGQGTTSINITTGSTSGNVCVTASNSCETTSATCKAVTIASPSLSTGLILAWAGTIASIPSGYNLCDGTSGTPDLRDSFVKGAPASTNPGGTGGATTHDHGGTAVTNVTTGNSGTATCGVAGSSCSWLVNAMSHSHTFNHSHTITAASNNPPYYEVLFIMKN